MVNIIPGKDNFDFKVLYKNGENSSNPLWQKVLDGLRSGDKRWKTVNTEGKYCGHPGVRDAGNRCVFCVLEKNERARSKMLESASVAKEDYVASLRAKADEMDNSAAMLRAEAFRIELGDLPWPPEGVALVTRKQAIERGEKWYMPSIPCRHCGITAEKYVANGRCRNCGK